MSWNGETTSSERNKECFFVFRFLFFFLEFGFLFFFSFFIYLFIYFWLCWVFVSVRGLSLVVASGGHSSSRGTGLSLSRPLLLRSTGSRRAGSVVVAHGLSWSVACGIFPRPGLEPVSPALAGRFSTTAPPGKPKNVWWMTASTDVCDITLWASVPSSAE